MRGKNSVRKTRIITIDGSQYYEDRPHECRCCHFWKNRKVGCILGKENCYYLTEVMETEQEKKCRGCSYSNGGICVSASCYKDLTRRMERKSDDAAAACQKEEQIRQAGKLARRPLKVEQNHSLMAICERCHCYRPDFCYRTCLYTRCQKNDDRDVFRSRPLKCDPYAEGEAVEMNV